RFKGRLPPRQHRLRPVPRRFAGGPARGDAEISGEVTAKAQRPLVVIPARCEASNYDVQLHIGQSRDSGSGPSDHPGMTIFVHGTSESFGRRATTLWLRPLVLAA